MNRPFAVVVFICLFSTLFACKSETNPKVAVKKPEMSKDGLLREAVDKIAGDFDSRFEAMTENGIRVYIEQLIVALSMGGKNVTGTPPSPEMDESFWAELAFFAAAIRPESTTPIDRERAKVLVGEMLQSDLFFAPGSGFFFPSKDIKKIVWITESQAAVEFTHSAMEGVQYTFLKLDRGWLFDDILVTDSLGQSPP